MRLRSLAPLAGAVLLALAACASDDEGAYDVVKVAGDYEPLGACLRGELARYESGGVLVGYTVDAPHQRSRIWRDRRDSGFGGSDRVDSYDIFLRQAGPGEVIIGVRHTGLAFDVRAFMSQFAPMLQRCHAV
jgi:hypothetical protein